MNDDEERLKGLMAESIDINDTEGTGSFSG
jgi:hypothetical protein